MLTELYFIKVSAEYPFLPGKDWWDESGLVRNLEWGGSPSRNAPQLTVGCFTYFESNVIPLVEERS